MLLFIGRHNANHSPSKFLNPQNVNSREVGQNCFPCPRIIFCCQSVEYAIHRDRSGYYFSSLALCRSGMGDSNSRSRPPQQANTTLAGDPGRAPAERPSTKLGHSAKSLVARHGIEPCPPAFQTSTLPSSSRAKIWWTVRDSNSHFHGCRPWVIPLYEPPNWGEMRESNSRDRSHNPVPKPFGQSRHRIWSWSSESNTRRRGTSSLHCHCARPANFWSWHAASNCGRTLTMLPALPVELYQRSWRGDSNADHGLTRPALFPLSYTSTNFGGGGENCNPDDLLCRQMPCCLGYTTTYLERSTEIAPVLPDWRSGVLLLYELRVERAARVELASSGWRPEAPAAIPCSLFKKLWQG